MDLNKITTDLKAAQKQSLLIKQTSVLFGSQIAVVLFGVLIKSIQTRALTVEEYGTYAFFGTVTSFLALFFRFGFFNSLKVLLANTQDPNQEKQLLGAGFFIAFLIGLLYAGSIFLLSFAIDHMFNVSIAEILLIFSPLCFVLPFKMFISEVSVGSNQIKHIVLFDILSKATYLLIISLLFFYSSLTVSNLVFFNLSTLILSLGVIYFLIRPSFLNFRSSLTSIINKNKTYGWHYYTGAIVNQTTFKLDELFITYFVNVTQLGFYTLANMVCAPMALFSEAIFKSAYKKMAEKDHIPVKLLFYNTLWLVLCIVILYFLSHILIEFLFGVEYTPAAAMVIPLSIAYFFQGMYAPYSFLSVKSKGKEMRNVAIVEGIVNLLGNVILVPILEVNGAILATIIGRATHYIGLRYYYKKLTKY